MILRYVGSDLFLRSTYSYLCIIISARMKKTHLLIALAPLMGACAVNTGQVEVTVENPATASPETAIVELPASDILGRLGSDCFVVTDSEGRELCSQLTHDSLIIFEAAVAPGAKATYYVAASDTMPTYAPVAVGRLYPERADDLAWENDLVGFRAYGPATQAKGERAFGYDIFMKHYSAEPVLERLYEPETSPAVWAKVDSLRAIDPVLAEDFIKTFSYHIDHGLDMDCYAVGPTLGAGVAVPLLEGDSLSYSWCYDKAEVLDNGPLRYTVQLDFAPRAVEGDSAVVEHRRISLDKGAQLNRTLVWYDGLGSDIDVVAGFPLRDNPAFVQGDNILAVADPTQGDDNGKALLGIVFPAEAEMAPVIDNHRLVKTSISPDGALAYEWGFAWDREGKYPDIQAWAAYLRSVDNARKNPLKISYK